MRDPLPSGRLLRRGGHYQMFHANVSWFPSGFPRVCDPGVETTEAHESVQVAYIHQRGQVRIGPVHAALPVELQRAAQERLVVDDWAG